MKISMKNVFLVAISEYRKWLLTPRIIMVLAMMVPIREIVILPIIRASQYMNQPINVLEPCIATMNSNIITLLVPLVFIVLISSFPTVDGNMFFYIGRMGRSSWIIGEIMSDIMYTVTYVAILTAMILIQVAPYSFLADGWSIVATDYDRVSGNSTGTMSNLLAPNLFYQMAPYKAFALSLVLLLLWLMVCTLFFQMGSVFGRKILFFIILVVQIAAGCALSALDNRLMWFFPVCHSFLKPHYQAYFRKYVFSPYLSVLILATIQGVLIILIYRKAKTVNLDTIGGPQQ